MGFDQGRDEELCVTQTGAGRPDRVHRMDAGWSPEAFEVCRVREDKAAKDVMRQIEG
jgi:hypothetical protein